MRRSLGCPSKAFTFAERSFCRPFSIESPERSKGEPPSAQIAAAKASRASSRIVTWPAYFGSQSTAQESGAGRTLDLLYAIPVVPHMYGTEYWFFGSYSSPRNLEERFLKLEILARSSG